MSAQRISVFSTCPQSKHVPPEDYLEQVRRVAGWSESYGCRGILVYADNSLIDPWHVSQHILQHTETLAPLIAVQPVYMHPYSAAKRVASLAYLYNRPIMLNMIAGGFKNDLLALNDDTPHDDRYVRLTEYTQIIRQLLSSDQPVTFEGKYYTVRGLAMSPSLPEQLMPTVLMSGSSPAGMQAARDVGAVAIKYPQRSSEEVLDTAETSQPCGVRVGIIARESAEEAWQVAYERFPVDRRGQVMHRLAMNVSDSHWHRQLSELAEESTEKNDPYWLGPFTNYRTFCPYLVGSYESIADELRKYMQIGHDTFILDIPPDEEELWHTHVTFREAMESHSIGDTQTIPSQTETPKSESGEPGWSIPAP